VLETPPRTRREVHDVFEVCWSQTSDTTERTHRDVARTPAAIGSPGAQLGAAVESKDLLQSQRLGGFAGRSKQELASNQ
jgi:hypothetical protein